MKSKEEILAKLTDEQREAVIHYNGMMVISATAGSGKTSCIVSKVEYMLYCGIQPENILLFTFTKKAANEMKERINDRIGSLSDKMSISTYHSFCSRLLRKYANLLGFTNDFSIYDSSESKSVLTKLLKKRKEKILTPDVARTYISKWKSSSISVNTACNIKFNNALEHRTAKYYYDDYQKQLKKQNAMDFDDLLYYAFKLLKDSREVREYVWNKYHYIIVDEFQDSSEQNVDFILKLGEDKHNICMVMDSNQSIYSFRGANIENVVNTIINNNAKEYILNRNFRSTQNIVNASQTLIDCNNSVLKKNTFSENEVGDKIYNCSLKSPKAESNFVSQIITYLTTKKGYSFDDIAILSRVNSSSRIIEDTFIANQIPYDVVGGLGFYERKEIKDIVSYLKLALNPYDKEAFERAITNPKCFVSDTTINKLEDMLYDGKIDDADMVSEYDLISVIEAYGKAFNKRTHNSLDKFAKTIRSIQSKIEDGYKLNSIISWLISEIKYKDYIRKYDKVVENHINREDNLEELTNLASQFETLRDFIEFVVLNSAVKEDNQENNKVHIMSVHASKGLEFKVVIVIGMNESVFPHKRAIQEGSIKEERRLFYVAMTRAKELLFLTHSTTGYNGRFSVFTPSRFLDEINQDYIINSDM